MTISTNWWWIRHAPVINAAARIYGQKDEPSDCTDTPSFESLARILPRDAIWLHTSLRRTHETGLAVAAAMGATPDFVVEPELMEQHLGEWQGLPRQEFYDSRGAGAHRFWLAPAHEKPAGGESFMELMARVSNAVLRLSQQHPGRNILAFSHGGTIRAALALALKMDAESALSFQIDNLSLTRIEQLAHDGQPPLWRVVTVNQPPVAATAPHHPA